VGFFPLFIGVEAVLGIAILNKAGGVYGVLSLFTGHPINFWQWLYNMLAISTLPIYIPALIHLNNKEKNIRKMSLATVVYTLDTLIGLFYTVYFIFFWFSSEDDSVKVNKRSYTPDTPDLSGQSASEGRELFVTFSLTLAITVIRLYFNLVVISFTKALLKQDASDERYKDNTTRRESNDLSSSKGISASINKFIFRLESKCKDVLNNFFKQG
jgi:hypothetical protein